MEFVGQSSPSGACCSLLGVPGLIPVDVDNDDDGEVVIGIRPKSSPLPRRKSSITDEDSEPEPPPCGSRRVSFADTKGLSLVQVKEFDTWDVPRLPGYDTSEGNGNDTEEYFLSTVTFSLPLSTVELSSKVRDQKVELESIELLPGTTIVKGVIRVLNISFTKAVYIRTSLDTWSTHFDLLAEFIPGSSDGLTDCFSFKLTLVPPFGEQGARVDFCLRYETSVGTFWANNNNRNYVLFCHHRRKEEKEKIQKETVNKKSCLKAVSQNFSSEENISTKEASSQETISTDQPKNGLEEDGMKTKKTTDGQSGTSLEDKEKLLMENRQNRSRRSRRKAARMARVRERFAQREAEIKDTERSTSEIKQAEPQEEKHEDVASCPESNNKSDDSQFVSESVKTCILYDVHHDTSATHDCSFNSEPEKSESITSLAESVTLTESEKATDKPSDEEPAPAEQQSLNTSVNMAEESSEHLINQNNNSFTFGTVVAPLYHQVFGKVGSESQTQCDCGNPVWANVNVVNPVSERKQMSCSDGAVQDSQYECSKDTCKTGGDKSLTENPTEMKNSEEQNTNTSECRLLGDTLGHFKTINITNESLDLQRETEEDDGMQTQSSPEPQINTKIHETPSQSDTEEVGISPFQSCLNESMISTEEENHKNTEASVKDDTLHDLNSNHNNNSLTKESESCFSCCEIVKENDHTTHEDEMKVIDELVESMIKEVMSNVYLWLQDKNTEEEETTVSKQDEDLCLAEKNWEMMVEEEENEAINMEPEEETTCTTEEKKEETAEGVMEDVEHQEEEEEICEGEDPKNVLEYDKVTKIMREDEERKKTEGPEEREKHFTDTPEVIIERKNIHEEEEEEEEEEKMEKNNDAEVKSEERNEKEENLDYRDEIQTDGAKEIIDTIEVESFHETQNKHEDGLSAPVNSELEEDQTPTCVYNRDDFQSDTCDLCMLLTDEPENDQTGNESESAESDSDDEMELYMHCLRAVHMGAQTHKDGGFTGSKRPPVSRSKRLSSPMPSISESLDEEQHLSSFSIQEKKQEDVKTAAGQSALRAEENINVSWWKGFSFSCSSISKTLVYSTLLVVFLVVAYHYDFLACFGLYLISVVWLYCQGERQPVKNNKNRIG